MTNSTPAVVGVGGAALGPQTALAGGGWRRVRHNDNSNRWGTFLDRLSGTAVVGTPDVDTAPWSVRFDTETYTEIMFASGNGNHWMVMPKDQVNGEWYSG